MLTRPVSLPLLLLPVSDVRPDVATGEAGLVGSDEVSFSGLLKLSSPLPFCLGTPSCKSCSKVSAAPLPMSTRACRGRRAVEVLNRPGSPGILGPT